MTPMTTHDRDAKNLRRRAKRNSRTVREQAHVECLRMLRTSRATAVVAHLQMALTAEGMAS